MRQEGEASVEEILESIKKVIARDNRAGALEERRRRESDGLQQLAAEFGSDGETQAAELAALPELDAEDSSAEINDDGILDLGAGDFVEQSENFSQFDEDADLTSEDAPLTADPLRDSMRKNFAALAMLAQPGARPQIVRSGETSLEGLAREMLRPMLAEWLETNLPGMVEKMVQAEIARIAGKRG